MIVVTGAAGFIGSCLIGHLNTLGMKDLILVDDFSRPEKARNLSGKTFSQKVDRRQFFSWMEENGRDVSFVFHIGARTDTTEFNMAVFDELNLNYSKKVWELCTRLSVPLLYASSAATYGNGEFGYDDTEAGLSDKLAPLNPYGISKNEFDRWVFQQKMSPPRWYGMKFFNVFGPNEYHKGRMASVIFHAYHQVKEKGSVRLFRSHHPDYPDGGQLRDFVYVKDVIRVLGFLMTSNAPSGIYNLGTGKARTFLDLAGAVFHSLGLEPRIEFIDTPVDIRDKYQYFTEARMVKLINAGYSLPFHPLEEAVKDYVTGFLATGENF